VFERMARRCNQCLMSANKIVSDERRRQLLASMRETDNHFQCHKGTIAGRVIACRGHYDATGGGVIGRLARALNVAPIDIDPDTLQPVDLPPAPRPVPEEGTAHGHP
jgi:hypothetical protein